MKSSDSQKSYLEIMVAQNVSVEEAARRMNKSYDSMQKVRKLFRKEGYIYSNSDPSEYMESSALDGKLTLAGKEYALSKFDIRPLPHTEYGVPSSQAQTQPKHHRRTKAEMIDAKAATMPVKSKRHRRTKAEMEAAKAEVFKKGVRIRPSKYKEISEISLEEYKNLEVGDTVLVHGNICHINGAIISKYRNSKIYRLGSGRPSSRKIRIHKETPGTVRVKLHKKETNLHG